MAASAVVVHLEVLDHDHGHWCRTCNLSTGFRVIFTTRIGEAVSIRQQAWCVECGGRDIEVGDGRHC